MGGTRLVVGRAHCVAAPFGVLKTRCTLLTIYFTMKDSVWSVPGSLFEVEDEPQNEDSPLAVAFKGIAGNTWAAKLASCNGCNCCIRHTLRHPTVLAPFHRVPTPAGNVLTRGTHIYVQSENDPELALDELEAAPVRHEKCYCQCRHMARFICRQIETDGSMPPCPGGFTIWDCAEDPV